MKKNILFIIIGCCLLISASNIANAQFSGYFQMEAQTYKEDSLMEAQKVNEQIQSNGFLNLNYTNGGLTAGVRYEYYLNPLSGIDPKYKGQGLAFRYATYSNDLIEVTAGNYYEQFGSGMIFRSYEEKALGIDNAMDGARFKLTPMNGINITGIYGTQRNFWSQGAGIVRGGDLNLSLNDILNSNNSNIFIAGASVISVYQADKDATYKMPENVLAYSARAALTGDNYAIDAEYSYKYNNPSAANNYKYNDGYGLILNGSYFISGFSAALNLHKIDNMYFRSDRYATTSDLMLSYIPPLTRQNTYRLATMYPYATQLNGEAGLQAEIEYKIPKNTLLGGKYGTDILLNYSRVQSNDTTNIDQFTYKSPFFGIGDDLYFQDLGLYISRKFSNKVKGALSYNNIIYNKDVIENSGVPNSGKTYANVLVAEGSYRINSNYSLKIEAQHLWAHQDSAITSHDITNGNWLGLLAEITISPGWFITIYDDWNYGNDDANRRIHYFNGNIAYTTGATRLSLGYGRQRAGILCVGGVCRQVPASNGFYLSINTSF